MELPRIEHPASAKFVLRVGDDVATFETVLKPRCLWRVHGMQHTHTDIGYTHIERELYKLHADYIDMALDYCQQTDGFPEEAKFRWVLEVSWQVANYMSQRLAGRQEELWERIRQGPIELTGLYGNVTELYSYEELIGCLYLSASLAEAHGLLLKVAVPRQGRRRRAWSQWVQHQGIRFARPVSQASWRLTPGRFRSPTTRLPSPWAREPAHHEAAS